MFDHSKIQGPRHNLHNLFLSVLDVDVELVRTDYQEIKKILERLDTKKIHEVSTKESSATSIYLCSQDVVEGEKIEMMINYTYKDSGR